MLTPMVPQPPATPVASMARRQVSVALEGPAEMLTQLMETSSESLKSHFVSRVFTSQNVSLVSKSSS